MAQVPVLGYQLQVSTNPPQSPGAPPVEFVPRVFLQFQPNGPFQPMPIKSNAEFMAICTLLTAPGRLFFDSNQQTFEKILP